MANSKDTLFRSSVLTAIDPELARIRDYLQSQAATKSLPELIERVREGVDELTAAAKALDRSKLNDVPPSESGTSEPWTPTACLEHALGSNAHVGREVLYVAHTGELPQPEDDSLPTELDALLQFHDQAIESTYAHVEDADPEANLDVKWNHPMFGELNWREWFLFLRIHSKDHARQLRAMAESQAA